MTGQSAQNPVVAPFPPPPPDDSAPYLRLLHRALEDRGVTIRRVESLSPRVARRGRLDAVHLHWLEYLVQAPGPPGIRHARAAARAARVVVSLAALRRTGVRIVWTVHNLQSHESRHPRLNAFVARAVGRLAHALVVHSHYAAKRVEERIGGVGKIHVIPHGHFRELYPASSASRAEIRRRLSLPEDAFAYLVFGQLRGYKLVPETVAAFRAIEDPQARLIVAGSAWDPAVREEIERAAEGDERILLRLEFVPDDEVAAYHAAADVAVIAYREVFSSGALLLALGFGLPVVAPAAGTAAEIAGSAADTFEPGGLTAAMRAAAAGDNADKSRAAAEAATRCSWELIAERTVALYR